CVLTLKESVESDAVDIPKTITELYKRAIKVLLWRHHPLCKLGSIGRPKGYLVQKLPKVFGKDVQEMKSLGRKIVEEGILIFVEPSISDFHHLANCGLLHQIPDKRRNLLCFLHLTLQEFLAAWCIVDDWHCIANFLDDHVEDFQWHLVIEFIVGLVGDLKREKKVESICHIEERFQKWIMLLQSYSGDKRLAFLGIQCLYELRDGDVIRSACTKLKHGSQEIFVNNITFTPVYSNALFQFATECAHITKLNFRTCQLLDKYSCNGIETFLSNGASYNLTSLSFHGCKFNDNFMSHLTKAVKSKNCKLAELDICHSNIADQGAKYLSEAFKSENCYLIKFIIRHNNITDEGAKYLCETFESNICKLSKLDIGQNSIADVGSFHISQALKSKNCNLTELDLRQDSVTDEGATFLG
ncbi:NACHT, LRR and PYD domains-containing protein 14-like, partial [Xenia sp. Carnegie-2017]|uniref:NACHT, LRR and PYD domains-containing protein 14-like n=1 Tax=Xenia sp. Carnegie-2017 TaxID=2897299 RepID=UPI001F043980